MMKSTIDTNDSVPGLDAVEFQVFKNALKCAAFPVLGAPDPPAESTPVPYQRSPTMLRPSPRGKRLEMLVIFYMSYFSNFNIVNHDKC